MFAPSHTCSSPTPTQSDLVHRLMHAEERSTQKKARHAESMEDWVMMNVRPDLIQRVK